ncbi:MAG: hypothetical protein ACRDWA_02990 [Acidimicrobiia bacterium]
MVLLSGEAGHGKPSVIDTLLAQLDHKYRVMVDSCEPMGIPSGFARCSRFLRICPTIFGATFDRGLGGPRLCEHARPDQEGTSGHGLRRHPLDGRSLQRGEERVEWMQPSLWQVVVRVAVAVAEVE